LHEVKEAVSLVQHGTGSRPDRLWIIAIHYNIHRLNSFLPMISLVDAFLSISQSAAASLQHHIFGRFERQAAQEL